MYDFTFNLPTKVVFGRNVNSQIGEELRVAGISKVLLLYGGGSIHRTGVFGEVAESLQKNEIHFVECPGVKPNPVISKTRIAIDIIRSEKLQAIVAIGGGSVIDSAKAAAAGALYDGDVWDLFMKRANVEAALPIYTVVTVSATASEMNFSSVQTNKETGMKIGLHSHYLFPKTTFIDPSVQATVPEKQTIEGGIDAISHLLETYFSASKGVEIQQEYIEGLVRSLIKLIPMLQKDPSDYDSRSQYAWASVCALNGTAFAGYRLRGDFSSHALGHMLSARRDAVHGATLAVMMPAWMKYVYREDLPNFARFAERVFGISDGSCEERALAGIEALRSYFASIGSPVTLRELGVNEEDLREYADAVTKTAPIGVLKKLSFQDALAIYKLAY